MSTTSIRKTLIAFSPMFVAAGVLLISYSRQQYPGTAGGQFLESPASVLIAGALAVALLILITPFMMGLPVRGLGYVTAIIQGSDNRPSTSKIQAFWWSSAVFFAYGALKARQLQMGMGGSLSLPRMLLVAIGASVVTAGAAKALAVRQAGKNEGAPNASPNSAAGPTDPNADAIAPAAAGATPTGNGAVSGQDVEKKLPPAGDLRYAVTDDAGGIDLGKIQLLSWTLVAIAIFLWQVGKLVFGNEPYTSLPDIDSALLVLSGVSQGAYLGQKLVPDNTPWLLSLQPSTKSVADINAGGQVTLKGKNFGSEQDGSMVTLNETPVALQIDSWLENEIKFVLPKGLKPNTVVYVGVVVGGQMSANALPFAVT